MELFQKTNIDFIGNRKIFYAISGIMILISTVSFLTKGIILGIDFSGGLLMQVNFDKEITTDQVRSELGKLNHSGAQIQKISGQNTYILRLKSEKDISLEFKALLSADFPDIAVNIERVEFVGPAVGAWLIEKALLAFVFSFIGIVFYVGIRFKGGVWGAAGVLALVHDVYITTGLVSLTGRELTLTVIASLLTLVGYSINDTIVVYDRIREYIRLRFKENPANIFNYSINSTLGRTSMTSLTTLTAVAALYFLGSAPIKDFSFCLLFGVIIGTYSSIFVASPLVYEWKMRKK